MRGRLRRAALVVPDAVARVSILRFETLPARAEDLAELVKWQIRRTVPFRLEEAQLASAPLAPLDGALMARKRMFVDPSRAVRELGAPRSPVREALLLNQWDWALPIVAAIYLGAALRWHRLLRATAKERSSPGPSPSPPPAPRR